MACNILSPISIWGDFIVPKKPTYSLIESVTSDGYLINKYYVDGRLTEKGNVKIFVKTIQKQTKKELSAIIFMKDFEHIGLDKALYSIADEGYLGVYVDIEGTTINVENEESSLTNEQTIYPQEVCYANYVNAKFLLGKVDDGVKNSPYFEWCAVLKYAINFVANIDGVERVGAVGYGQVATILWQASMENANLSALVFLRNVGWESYKGNYKFDDKIEPQFDDDKLVYIAGVEPQSYAQYIKCPTYIIANANESVYEPDRAHDTLKRVGNEKKGLYYEHKLIKGFSKESTDTIKEFFDQTLNGDKRSIRIVEPLISSKIENGICKIFVEVFDKNVESVKLFASEEEFNPEYRSYIEVGDYEVKGRIYTFSYIPYSKSKRVMFFASVKNENGISISSNIEVVEFNEQDVLSTCKSPIIYSCRADGMETIFLSQDGIEYEDVFNSNKKVLQVETGAQSIKGLSIKGGVITFSIKTEKYKPKIDNFLMFDLFSKAQCEVYVNLYSNYYGNRVKYSYKVKLDGVSIWQNQKIDFSRFKTEEGRPLKELENIDALEFYSSEEALINNLLWV